jgi:hypothetical protein
MEVIEQQRPQHQFAKTQALNL